MRDNCPVCGEEIEMTPEYIIEHLDKHSKFELFELLFAMGFNDKLQREQMMRWVDKAQRQ